jgi:hypothetical protein
MGRENPETDKEIEMWNLFEGQREKPGTRDSAFFDVSGTARGELPSCCRAENAGGTDLQGATQAPEKPILSFRPAATSVFQLHKLDVITV